MDHYVAVVFNTDRHAFDALHALWDLDDRGDVTVHGAAVIHRDAHGAVDVATKKTDRGLRTAAGIAIGALLGALAGPIGAVAGTTIAVGTAAGIGAATGGAVGLTADVVTSQERGQAAVETGFVLLAGQSALIADASEDGTTALDSAMSALGGTVYRRAKTDVLGDLMWAEYPLYPYDYAPAFT
ncbi:MAG TPA: hypothetical protein VHT05_15370 [Candidatus Elarobacter sp.]|jgi:uncharacterized membrane protein|nr:hypothetical protein [Candidatus Elarobacter sp.]